MKLSQIYSSDTRRISFEVFPPKPDIPIDTVFDTISGLKKLNPSYISVTYGAGGSSRGRTVEIASKIKNEYGLEAMAHLSCAGHTKADIDYILEDLKQKGIENILALRGDPPINQPDFDYNKNDFRYAVELIEYIKSKGDFSIAAAAYPEGHKDSKSITKDWCYLKEKVDAGVDVLITQLFFDNRIFYHFMEDITKLGIHCPVIPGIMPIFNSKQIKRIISLCGSSMPGELLIMLDKYGDSQEDLRKAGIDYAIRQIQDLLDHGVLGIHLEPMNRPALAEEIIKGLNYKFN